MKKLTREEAIELHKKMWNWIADETERTGEFVGKSNYFEAMGIPYDDRPNYDCDCCEYAIQQNNGEEFAEYCKYCPLNWESESNGFMCLHKKFRGDCEGLFKRWLSTQDMKERAALARKIANLEVR